MFWRQPRKQQQYQLQPGLQALLWDETDVSFLLPLYCV